MVFYFFLISGLIYPAPPTFVLERGIAGYSVYLFVLSHHLMLHVVTHWLAQVNVIARRARSYFSTRHRVINTYRTYVNYRAM